MHGLICLFKAFESCTFMPTGFGDVTPARYGKGTGFIGLSVLKYTLNIDCTLHPHIYGNESSIHLYAMPLCR